MLSEKMRVSMTFDKALDGIRLGTFEADVGCMSAIVVIESSGYCGGDEHLYSFAHGLRDPCMDTQTPPSLAAIRFESLLQRQWPAISFSPALVRLEDRLTVNTTSHVGERMCSYFPYPSSTPFSSYPLQSMNRDEHQAHSE